MTMKWTLTTEIPRLPFCGPVSSLGTAGSSQCKVLLEIEIDFRPLRFPFIQTLCSNIKPAVVPLMFLWVDLISTFQVEMAEDI
jgi:hypothetical protein